MASDVKAKMIERTAILLAQKGLQGTSFSEVLEASGAPRGSLYHHFPGGKDELVLAAVNAAGQRAAGALAAMQGKPAGEVAETFIALWRDILIKGHFSAGCAVVAVTVAADQKDLLAATASAFQSWQNLLTDLFVSGGIQKSRAPGLATTLISACEGAVILSRAQKSLEPFDLVAAEQINMIKAAT